MILSGTACTASQAAVGANGSRLRAEDEGGTT